MSPAVKRRSDGPPHLEPEDMNSALRFFSLIADPPLPAGLVLA